MGLIRILLCQAWKLAKKRDADRMNRQMPVPGVYVETDIPYLDDGDPMHQLNLYYPAGYDRERDGSLPSIIDIHGGGLMYGDKELNRRYCEYLASRGYCVMGMSYRLLSKTNLQGMLQDVFASMYWLEHCGKIRGFDLSRVFLTGDSAGGHLASLVMCIQQSPYLQKIYDVRPVGFCFSAVAICNGVCEMHDYYSFTKRLSKMIDREMVSMILGKSGRKVAWRNYISSSQVISQVQELPPVLVLGAERDPFYQQTLWVMKNLQQHGCVFETLIWKKEDGVHLGHVFQVSHWEWQESKITNDRMLEFFRCAADSQHSVNQDVPSNA